MKKMRQELLHKHPDDLSRISVGQKSCKHFQHWETPYSLTPLMCSCPHEGELESPLLYLSKPNI